MTGDPLAAIEAELVCRCTLVLTDFGDRLRIECAGDTYLTPAAARQLVAAVNT